MTIVAIHVQKPDDRLREKWWTVRTKWGYCGMVWRVGGTPNGAGAHDSKMFLVKIIAAQPVVAALAARIAREFPQAQAQGQRDGNWQKLSRIQGLHRVAMLAQFLCDYYGRSREALRFDRSMWADWLPHLDMGGLSPFAQSVLRRVAEIPPGQTESYGHIAACLGRPRAARAVGGALGANPFPVLIPCHRVIGKSGKLTGFSAPGGVAAKKRMIEREASLIR